MSLRDAFRSARTGFGRKEFPMQQKHELKKLNLDSKGVCQGLCMAHAALRKAGRKTRVKEDTDFGMDELFAYANKAQQHFETIGNPDDLASVGRMYQHLGKHFDLKMKTIREYSCGNDDVKAMYQWAAQRKPGYFQVLLPNHVVSFHITDDIISYFDPNCGSVKFAGLNDLSTFLNFYHTHPQFRKEYGLGEALPSSRPLFLVGLE